MVTGYIFSFSVVFIYLDLQKFFLDLSNSFYMHFAVKNLKEGHLVADSLTKYVSFLFYSIAFEQNPFSDLISKCNSFGLKG